MSMVKVKINDNSTKEEINMEELMNEVNKKYKELLTELNYLKN